LCHVCFFAKCGKISAEFCDVKHIYDHAFLEIEEVLRGLQSKFDSHRGEGHKTSSLKSDPFFKLFTS